MLNEITLSKDLNVITAEINSYKQIAGQAIFEIGKRLKHVKENDLVHGEWTEWCENQVGISRDYANRYVRVYEEIGNNDTYRDLGVQALYLIATMPEEEREKEHVTSKGETKTVDEMTVRELQEVKRQLNLEQKERERLEQENEELANQEPETIEVVPDDYDYIKGNYESAVSLQKRYKEQLEEMRDELNKAHNELQNRSKSDTNDSELEHLKKKEDAIKRRLDSYEKIHQIQTLFENVILEVERLKNKLHVDVGIDSWKVEEYENCLNNVINLCEDLKYDLPNKNIIEGEIVND